MHLSSERVDLGRASLPAPESLLYSVLSFGSRSAAVRYCLRVSDVLGEAGTGSTNDAANATLWLGADMEDGAIRVFACDRAIAAARSVGMDALVSARVRHTELPSARCLVVGDPARHIDR
jgi:hypothetical protein